MGVKTLEKTYKVTLEKIIYQKRFSRRKVIEKKKGKRDTKFIISSLSPKWIMKDYSYTFHELHARRANTFAKRKVMMRDKKWAKG